MSSSRIKCYTFGIDDPSTSKIGPQKPTNSWLNRKPIAKLILNNHPSSEIPLSYIRKTRSLEQKENAFLSTLSFQFFSPCLYSLLLSCVYGHFLLLQFQFEYKHKRNILIKEEWEMGEWTLKRKTHYSSYHIIKIQSKAAYDRKW